MTTDTNKLAHKPMTEEARRAIERRDDSQKMAVYSPTEGATLHDHDRRHAVIQLAQSQSALGLPGKFVRTDTEEEFEYIDVVPIAVLAQRTYWGPGEFSRDRDPLCMSFDGITAAHALRDGTPTQFPGQDCRSCQHYTAKPWLDKSQDGWCSPGYIVALMDADTYEGYIIRLNNTAAKLGRTFAHKGILRRAVVRLSSEQTTSDRGIWYALKTKTMRKLDDADLDLAHDLLADFDTLGQDDVESEPAATPAPAPTQPWNEDDQPSPVPQKEPPPTVPDGQQVAEVDATVEEQEELEVPW